MVDSAEGRTLSLGTLTVGEELGRGGFGVVHRATIPGIDAPFAVKLLDPSPFNEPAEICKKRFFQEANLLFRFRHPCIVAIYNVGEHEGRPYILMEYFPGLNLAQVRERHGAPPADKVLPFFEMVSDALAHAHERGVVHRDLKPQNLMTTKGAARILDFGVGVLLDPKGERFTRLSAQVGGDAFSAPEIVEQPGSADPRSDIYSVGACWYWLLTGAAPRGLNLQEKLRASVKLDQSYEGVLMKCLDQVEGRYQSASDLAADIRRLRGGEAPNAGGFEPSDDEARLMGVAVGACPTAVDRVSFYQLEQELRGRMTRLRTALALKALLRREFLDAAELQDARDGTPYVAYVPSYAGAAWTAKQVKRIEMLDPAPSLLVDIVGPDDDMPF